MVAMVGDFDDKLQFPGIKLGQSKVLYGTCIHVHVQYMQTLTSSASVDDGR